MKTLVFAGLFLVVGMVSAKDSHLVIKGDFEGNGKVDYFKYDTANIGGGVDYYSSSSDKTYHYDVEIKGECGLAQLYKPDDAKNRIIIDGSCTGKGAQVHEYIYEWKKNNGWCLKSEVTGEKADSTSGSDADLTTTKVEGCIPFGKSDN